MIEERDAAEIVRLYQAGYGERRIARRLYLSESTVKRVLLGKHRYANRRVMNGRRPAGQLARE